jgi:hypothetical protein
VRILDASGEEVATVTIVEAIDRKMEFTVHLREVPTGGEYTAFATVYYAEAGEEIRQGDGGDEIKNLTPIPSEITVIDRAETRFQIPI